MDSATFNMSAKGKAKNLMPHLSSGDSRLKAKNSMHPLSSQRTDDVANRLGPPEKAIKCNEDCSEGALEKTYLIIFNDGEIMVFVLKMMFCFAV